MAEQYKTVCMNNENLNASQKIILDLSFQNITSIPPFSVINLQYLYLENNKLCELPYRLFLDAPKLKWLDVRDNEIQKIPDSIENHGCIESLLLQNNHISYLPLVLGTVKSLKNLHLSGNPLIYPEKSIISAGIEVLLSYLNSQFHKEKRSKDIDISIKSVSDSQGHENEDNDIKHYNQRNTDEDNNSDCSEESINSQRELQSKTKQNVSFDTNKTKLSPLSKKYAENGINQKHIPFKNSDKYIKKEIVRTKEEQEGKIQESLIKDMWLEARTDLLNRREKVLQDRKSLEVLRKWRRTYKIDKVCTEKEYYALDLENLPYDTDINYVKILTRADLEQDLPDKYKKNKVLKHITRSSEKEKPNIQLKIDEIIDNMNSIKSENYNWSPRDEVKMITCEIKKLSELKKRITQLKLENDVYY